MDITGWTKKTVAKYLKICATVKPILLAFPSLYMVETIQPCALFTKQTEKHFEQRTWWFLIGWLGLMAYQPL